MKFKANEKNKTRKFENLRVLFFRQKGGNKILVNGIFAVTFQNDAFDFANINTRESD